MRAIALSALLLSGCAGLDLARADICLRKKLEVEIPLERGVTFTPKPCKSKEVLTKLLS